jgi:hypothetical protein
MQCVASSVPYVGLAVGGLKAMTFKAKMSRTRLATDAGPAASAAAARPSRRPAAVPKPGTRRRS